MKNPKNSHRYAAERVYRWWSADEGEEPAMERVVADVQKLLGRQISLEFIRYDKIIHQKHNPDLPENEWAKGCPDYALRIQLENQEVFYYCLFEIKLKYEEFRKTVTGGKTRHGSDIAKYGCESYYLDIVPVYQNMLNFCAEMRVDKRAFILAFASPNAPIRIISLSKIESMVRDGWLTMLEGEEVNIRLCIYGEGYGQETYLIPKDSTRRLIDINPEDFIRIIRDVGTSMPYL